MRKQFVEQDHPRNHGKFSSKPGSKGDSNESTLINRISEVPKSVRQKAKAAVIRKYKQFEARYGRKGAIAILTAAIALMPVPVPGTSLLPIAIAEAIVRTKRAMSKKEKGYTNATQELSDEEAKKLAEKFLAELMDELGESAPTDDDN